MADLHEDTSNRPAQRAPRAVFIEKLSVPLHNGRGRQDKPSELGSQSRLHPLNKVVAGDGMLKRLELVGFKSFADKTQFDFPAGITAVVGPNGSGKSNIVDAVRWTLGEQSAKSLRGGEMADVIFNGSTSRRSLGMAEVTLTFDNRQRILSTDADEVAITRRVYRDGEGEYLINHQVCRLRDVKELFLGTGAGTDAYSIIEQGKVDVLLQASTRERRTIFEEAAGISRFKAKKIETLRKLERVDQNLERLKDIIAEVEKQFRSVKLQAAKAERYQEYSNQLRDLRIELGLEEYRQFSERLDEEMAVLDRLRAELHERGAHVEAWDKELKELERRLEELDQAVHAQEAAHAQAAQQIATAETTLNHERLLREDLDGELAATRNRLAGLIGRVQSLAAETNRAAAELAEIERHCREQHDRVRALDEELAATAQRVADLQSQTQADKVEHLERMRQAARLHNDAVSCQARHDHLRGERERLLRRTEAAAEHLTSLNLELQELARAEAALNGRLEAARNNLTDQRHARERAQQMAEALTQSVAEMRAHRSGLASRIEVLEGLQRSQEGLGTGVREVLAIVNEHRTHPMADDPWRTVLGIVADFLSVPREYASLIDLALGERAQQFVVRDVNLLTQILSNRAQPFGGRVGFFPLVAQTVSSTPSAIANHPGFIANAAQVVTCDHADVPDLPGQLLGQTLIVRDLDAARSMALLIPGRYRFVTLVGDLLEPDGTLTVGAHQAEIGILSRKSELLELREQIVTVDGRIQSAERELAGLRGSIMDLDRHTSSLQEEISVLAEQAADLRSRIGQRREQHEGLNEEVTLTRGEMTRVQVDLDRLESEWRQARSQAEAADRDVQDLQARLDAAERELREHESQRQLRQQEVTAAKVGLAKVEERLEGLRNAHRQLEKDLEERRVEQAQAEQHIAATQARLEECARLLEEAAGALAKSTAEKEICERRLAEFTAERDGVRSQRQQLVQRTEDVRTAWQAQQEQAHGHELAASEVRHEREALASRLREDYQVELAELFASSGGAHREDAETATREVFDRIAANERINELRRKLARLGSVNLDSLQELADLQARSQTLQSQFDDLTAAKRSLEEIISTINSDSRRLFTQTFEAIRMHFQELFRKLFGGGMADIVLEDENDILESGIEIIARPPGKELRSISLMSGGEKTLTAVAILLAIFRSKPSPFCILDEVDAALDEANIGRFTAVLRDFLDRSQFIIVTHSKKTMAVADVLYGVTMQESGISKQVAVRFEDWVEPDQAGENQLTAVGGV